MGGCRFVLYHQVIDRLARRRWRPSNVVHFLGGNGSLLEFSVSLTSISVKLSQQNATLWMTDTLVVTLESRLRGSNGPKSFMWASPAYIIHSNKATRLMHKWLTEVYASLIRNIILSENFNSSTEFPVSP